MKRIYTFFGFALLFASCLSENGAEQSKPSTFIRYYYGGSNDKAAAFEKTSDKGFILLSTVTITASEAQAARFKIKLTKTDEYGNPVWTEVFPDFSAASDSIDYKAKGIQILKNGAGYVVTGEDIDIKSDGSSTSRALVMTVSADGKSYQKMYIPKIATTPSMFGQAVAVNSNNDFAVLSTSSAPNNVGDTEMFLSEVNSTLTKQNWVQDYSAGVASLANRLFLDSLTNVAFWAGTVTRNNVTGIRVVKASPNSQNTFFDQLLLNPGFIEEATDFCRYGFGYAIVGSTDEKRDPSETDPHNHTKSTKGDKDILFKRLAEDGTELQSTSFPLGNGKTLVDTQNDVGNSISSTQDGGLILLASVGSLAIDGRGDNDYLLIHIDAFGKEMWRSHFGSRFNDTGVAVRQTSDGGYVVLGTSTQGGREIMMLAKTNNKGQIE